MTQKVLSGNYAAAHGVRLARAQVISAYPITPQTTIIEGIADLISKGELKAEFVKVESEHSAMAACIGAAQTGARTFTATSSQGLLLMHELLHWAAGARLPIVLVDVNRAVAPGWNIWTDQNDSLSQRDTGWIQLYCASAQEVIDTTIQAYRIAEQVSLPVMLVLDAFFLSHTYEAVEMPEQRAVDAYLPPLRAPLTLDVNRPRAFGNMAGPEVYMEFRYLMHEAMERALGAIETAGREFDNQFGRGYGLLETYRCEDAEDILLTSGTVASTARGVVEERRARGEKVGLVRMRAFRPFPKAALRAALQNAKRVAVIDRNCSYGHHGIFHEETKSALFDMPRRPEIYGFIAGLGGRDITPAVIEAALDGARKGAKDSQWLGLSASVAPKTSENAFSPSPIPSHQGRGASKTSPFMGEGRVRAKNLKKTRAGKGTAP